MQKLTLDIPDWKLSRQVKVDTHTENGMLRLVVTGVEPDGVPASIFRAVSVSSDLGALLTTMKVCMNMASSISKQVNVVRAVVGRGKLGLPQISSHNGFPISIHML